MKCFVIAEAGVNHNGSLDVALALVDAAAAAGADAVKFQTFRAKNVVHPGVAKADYQKTQTGEGDQFSMIQALELSEDSHRKIAMRCTEKEIEFMSTPFEVWAIDLLVGLGMRTIKVASGELTNRPFIEHLVSYDLPMIVSTGMATLGEVAESVAWMSDTRRTLGLTAPLAEKLILLHCTSNYPAAEDDVNLLAMNTLAAEFGVPVGYSDHTAGITVSLAAVALGAVAVEKHLTLDRKQIGPDHAASLEPDELAQMVSGIRTIERALGDGVKAPRPTELPVRDLVRRSVVTSRALPSGRVLAPEDLTLLRPGTGIPPRRLAELFGRTLVRPLEAGTIVAWDDLQ